MSNPFNTKWLAATLCTLALGSTSALAESDTFHLGDGHIDALEVKSPNTVINSYARVLSGMGAGSQSLTVDSIFCPEALNPCFKEKDLVMVLQVTSREHSTTRLDDTTPVGRWEFARLKLVTDGKLELTQPLIHTYEAGVTQVIRVPEYTNVTIAKSTTIAKGVNVPNSIVAPPWNWGTGTGGVIAFLATGDVINDGQINASKSGFSGGQYGDIENPPDSPACLAENASSYSGARRGEGIALDQHENVKSRAGRDNAVNGGGGGLCGRSGGGGGANGGNGGQGGNSRTGEGNKVVGGLGGAALDTSKARLRLTFGGGGGAGHGIEGSGQPGGRGGGIVFIRAKSVSGTGRILADGESSGGASSDGGSGAGAGGTLHLRFASTATCTTSSFNAIGGQGGNSGWQMGPGGGGGGGRILVQPASASCSPDDSSVRGTSSGKQSDPDDKDGDHGALGGTKGVVEKLSTALPAPSTLPVPTLSSPSHGKLLKVDEPGSIQGGNASVTSPAKGTVVIYIDGREVGRVEPDSSGNYSSPIPKNLSEERHMVQTAVEVDGVQGGKSEPRTFIVDTTPPVAKIVSGPPGLTNSTDATFPLTYEGKEPGAVTYMCKLDGEELPACSNSSSLKGLDDGEHTLEVLAKDEAGNTSAKAAVHTWTVDTMPPETRIISGPSGHTESRSGTFTFDVVRPEPGVTYECELDGKVESCDSTFTFDKLDDGEHTFLVRARDAATNKDLTEETRTWNIGHYSMRGGGCSATGGDASLVLMGLGSFLALARRRRRYPKQANTSTANVLRSSSAQSTRGVPSFFGSFLAAATLAPSSPAWGTRNGRGLAPGAKTPWNLARFGDLASRPCLPACTVRVMTHPHTMKLGNFSVSLAVKNLDASRAFYEKLGFEPVAGDPKQNWLILRNGPAIIGLFQGMFERNTLTFNPGWDSDCNTLPEFTDVRELQRRLKRAGVELTMEADESGKGPASFMVIDPDGNPILVDQHV